MSDSQKFLSRNRSPRVQIEYDVELYGAQKKVQLPFVMGVLSDLSGKAEQPSIAEREFLEIDVDNFDDRMKALAPRAQFSVPNTLTGDGNLSVDLTFEKMADFSPERIAEKVDVLRPLLEARRQLSDLMAYMDGKAGAEALIENLLAETSLLRALAGDPDAPKPDIENALESLRDKLPAEPDPETDETEQALASLANSAPPDEQPEDEQGAVLASIDRVDVADEEADATEEILSALEGPSDVPEEPSPESVLATIPVTPESAAADTDTVDDVLASLDPVDLHDEQTTVDDVLGALDRNETPSSPEESLDDVLAGLDKPELVESEKGEADSILASVQQVETLHQPEEDNVDDVLAGIESAETGEEAQDNSDAVLDEIKDAAAPTEDTAEEGLDDILATIEDTSTGSSVEDAASEESMEDVLAGIEPTDTSTEPVDSASEVLSAVKEGTPDQAPEESENLDDILSSLEATPNDTTAEEDNLDDVLSSIEADTSSGSLEENNLEDVLASIDAAPEGGSEGEETLDDVLGAIEAAPEEPNPESEDLEDILSSIETVSDSASAQDDLDLVLSELEAPATEPRASVATEDVLASMPSSESNLAEQPDDLDTLLAGLDAPEEPEADESVDAILSGLDGPPDPEEPQAGEDEVGLLEGLDNVIQADPEVDDLDELIGSMDTLDGPDAEAVPSSVSSEAKDDLNVADGSVDASDLSVPEMAGQQDAQSELNERMADHDAEDDLEALLSELEEQPPADETVIDVPQEDVDADDDLDDLLDDLTAESDTTQHPSQDQEAAALEAGTEADGADIGLSDDLDSLLSDLEGEPRGDTDDLDALLADLGGDDPSQANGDNSEPDNTEQPQSTDKVTASPFGTVSAPRPARDDLHRPVFRMAFFGDFTGRAARGLRETGAALAASVPIELDVDNIDETIARFATTLTLPLGKDGVAMEVKLSELDDLHPDELYENVEVFEALAGLRQQLDVGSLAENTVKTLKDWSEAYGTPIHLPKRSASVSVPSNLKLSDFQKLIGDTHVAPSEAGPLDDLMARIVGPHVVKAASTDATAMKSAVDDALSNAMRLLLHHPDFQAVEAQWRALDMLTRRIETDSKLQIVLYDISAEELAADLALHDDLAQSGVFRLLTDVLDPEEGVGGFSALFGLYSFEETPPHAELLARIAQLSAHVDAPFFSAISPGYLEIEKEDRHPLVAQTWDSLRSLPEANYVGLATPRFMLRNPYGAKSEPIYAFEFEEFTAKEGLRGMLWANPVVLVAILLAGAHKKDGRAMRLGDVMSLGDLPFHYVTDRHGDQVAMPCTDRNLTSAPTQRTIDRGYMPVVWMKGRNEIRLGSFRALGGFEIIGPWGDEGAARPALSSAAGADLTFEFSSADDEALTELLDGFEAEEPDPDSLEGEEEMDAELAALLEGL